MTTMEDLHDDVAKQFLILLDGESLAAASAATFNLRRLAADPVIWRHLCFAEWPSLSGDPFLSNLPSAAFYSQSHLFPDFFLHRSLPRPSRRLPSSLISAVDLHHDGAQVFSRVIKTEVSSQWFLGTPFRIDALDRNESSPSISKSGSRSPSDLTLSWIVVDPEEKKAVNLSSRRPVAVEKHWYRRETVARFVVVAGNDDREGGSGEAAVTAAVCVGEGGRIKEVSLVVEDLDGACMNGKESLAVIKEAMEVGRRLDGGERMMRRYQEHVRRMKEKKLRRMKVEGTLDTCCVAVGVIIFLTFFFLVVNC